MEHKKIYETLKKWLEENIKNEDYYNLQLKPYNIELDLLNPERFNSSICLEIQGQEVETGFELGITPNADAYQFYTIENQTEENIMGLLSSFKNHLKIQ